MKTFKYLEQRVITTYLDMLPSPASVQKEKDSAKKEIIGILNNSLLHLFENPSLLFKTLHEDDAYNNRFNKSADKKPELLKDIRTAEKKINAFIEFLSSPGAPEEEREKSKKLSTAFTGILSAAGIDTSSKKACNLLYAEIHVKGITNYRSLFFNEKSALENYRSLSGNPEQFDRLMEYLKPSYHVYLTPNSISLEYIKGKNNCVPERGGFQYKVNHIGVSMFYEPLVKMPSSYSICIPSMKKLLDFFDDMEDDLKQFILLMTKKCDGCRYCVQTDKTGTRPKAHISVIRKNTQYLLCPYFPGYSYTFDHLDEQIVTYTIKMLSFMDERLSYLTV